MNAHKLLLVTLGMGAGLGLGYYWGVAVRPAATSPEMSALRTAADEFKADNQRLKTELTRLSDNAKASAEAAPKGATERAAFTPLEKLQVLADLQQKNLVKPAITFLDRKGKLDASFIGLFALTPPEQQRLQQLVDNVREKLASLERDNATITRDAKGNIVVAIPPFPAEGGKVYDEMMGSFADVLGPERNEVYRKIGAEQFENSLGRFGAAERTYTFGYDTSERASQPYTFSDRVLQRTEHGGQSGFTNNTRFSTYDELVARVGPVVSILPPDYRRAK